MRLLDTCSPNNYAPAFVTLEPQSISTSTHASPIDLCFNSRRLSPTEKAPSMIEKPC